MGIHTNNDARFLSIAVEEANKSILRAKLGCVAEDIIIIRHTQETD